MPKTLDEGQADSSHKALIYPNITSCLSITAVCGGSLVGGHAVVFPAVGALSIGGIVDYIIPRAGTCSQVLLIGEVETWRQSLPDMNATTASGQPIRTPDDIADLIYPPARRAPGQIARVVSIDTDDWVHGNGFAEIRVSLETRTLSIFKGLRGVLEDKAVHKSYF